MLSRIIYRSFLSSLVFIPRPFPVKFKKSSCMVVLGSTIQGRSMLERHRFPTARFQPPFNDNTIAKLSIRKQEYLIEAWKGLTSVFLFSIFFSRC